jgi:DNA-binding transcriptional regulator YhcF (GntR family)
MDTKYLEKLTEAVYRVTDRMEDNEPLKWKIRASALSLSELYYENISIISDARTKTMLVLFDSLDRLLKLSSSLSYVAQINFDRLLREYTELRENLFIQEEKSLLAKVSEKEPDEKEFIEYKAPQINTNDRQQKIMEFLSSGENKGIHELAEYFVGAVSEKTIQRDLNELVTRGIVSTMGEKRWRKYKKN